LTFPKILFYIETPDFLNITFLKIQVAKIMTITLVEGVFILNMGASSQGRYSMNIGPHFTLKYFPRAQERLQQRIQTGYSLVGKAGA